MDLGDWQSFINSLQDTMETVPSVVWCHQVVFELTRDRLPVAQRRRQIDGP